MNTVGAKLMAAYGDDKYNFLEKIAPGEVRDLAEELRIKNLVEPYFNEYALSVKIKFKLRFRRHIKALIKSCLFFHFKIFFQ